MMSRKIQLLFFAVLLLGSSSAELTSLYDASSFHQYMGYSECSDQLFSDMVTSLNYPFASFTTTTDDGYILKLFRIQAKNTKMTAGKPVVFLQHGLIDSADGWVVNGEANSLGFVLANAGYDVWFGNSRGNKYSRMNNHIPTTRKEFWEYSFQDMGQYDVKANIGFILSFTNKPKLVYVGHSQGTSQMFAALSDPLTSSWVNARVSKFIALAPIVYLANSPCTFMRVVAKDNFLIDSAELFHVYEWLPGACSQTSAQSQFQSYVCKTAPSLCDFVLSLFDFDPKYDNQKMMPFYLLHTPSGTSLQTLLHYKQNLLQRDTHKPQFQKFDWGEKENLKRYGQRSPPLYDLSLINIPVRGFVGVEDQLGDTVDNSILAANMQELNKNYKAYTYNNCGHMTFMWALNASTIFADVLREIATA